LALESRRSPLVYRVHDQPERARLEALREVDTFVINP
jgi:exoribonuclease R